MAKNSTIDLNKYTDEQLIDLRIDLEIQLKSRGIKFSVGDIGETSAVSFFNRTPGLPNLQKAPTGVKNVDALSRDGHRYSIKTIQNGSKTGTIYPDEKEHNQLFEYLLVVKLNDNYQMISLNRISWEQFLKVRAWDKRMNAWYVPYTKIRMAEVEKIL